MQKLSLFLLKLAEWGEYISVVVCFRLPKQFVLNPRRINLIGANRVVLFDSHWNPTVTTQAMHRVYRYGQTKPTYCYRLITEGSIEEKIFGRASNKSGLAARVIDQKYPERNFSAEELADLQAIDSWVICDNCSQWRMLINGEDGEELPDKWYCHMNKDTFNNTCEHEEKSEKWYFEHRKRMAELRLSGGTLQGNTVHSQSIDTGIDEVSTEAKKVLLKKDIVLTNLGFMEVIDQNDKKKTKMTRQNNIAKLVSRIEFQEMMQADSNDLEIEARTESTVASHSAGTSQNVPEATTVISRKEPEAPTYPISAFPEEIESDVESTAISEEKSVTTCSNNAELVSSGKNDETCDSDNIRSNERPKKLRVSKTIVPRLKKGKNDVAKSATERVKKSKLDVDNKAVHTPGRGSLLANAAKKRTLKMSRIDINNDSSSGSDRDKGTKKQKIDIDGVIEILDTDEEANSASDFSA
mmetsp:Transcript_24524/g.35028  ORF Transcript_24524/g.35028 Transcript_24524/m.35028 type:complete len:468 (+) Transcript_24524:1670-3073(+)